MSGYCQSCGMPMGLSPKMYGTDVDGKKSKDYCGYCYRDGKFSDENMTLDDMVNKTITYYAKMCPDKTREQCISDMKESLKNLKRWQ